MAEAMATDEMESGNDAIIGEETAQLLQETAETINVEEEIRQHKESDAVEMNKAFKKSGMNGLAKMLQKKIDSWKDAEMNIAVTGRTGVGKSCFINAVRGNMNESQKGYAPVGTNECTKERHPYPHPNNKHLIFWDLPGAGTKSFPRKTYVKHPNIQFHSYDAFIIMACDRFTEDEIWLASEIKRLGKKFLFVRSKIDDQIRSDKKLKKKANKDHDPQAVVDEIRKDCIKNLENDQIRDIYLINNLDLSQGNLDFAELLDRLMAGFDGLKAEAFMYSIGFLTPKLIENKIVSLRRRIYGMGILSGISGAVPIPGTSLIADALLIANETRLYRKQLGLSDKDLQHLADLMEKPVNALAKQYSLKSMSLVLTTKGMAASTALIASEVLESVVGLTLPVIGMPVGAVLSAGLTIKILRSILSIIEKDAHVVLELLLLHTDKQIVELHC